MNNCLVVLLSHDHTISGLKIEGINSAELLTESFNDFLICLC